MTMSNDESNSQSPNPDPVTRYYFDHDTCALSMDQRTENQCCHKEGYEEVNFTWQYRPRVKDFYKGHTVEHFPITLYLCKTHKEKLYEIYETEDKFPMLVGWDCWEVYEQLSDIIDNALFDEVQL